MTHEQDKKQAGKNENYTKTANIKDRWQKLKAEGKN